MKRQREMYVSKLSVRQFRAPDLVPIDPEMYNRELKRVMAMQLADFLVDGLVKIIPEPSLRGEIHEVTFEILTPKPIPGASSTPVTVEDER